MIDRSERETYQRYSEARADYDAMPTDYNARLVMRWASKLADISDDYTAQYDEANDIMNDHF